MYKALTIQSTAAIAAVLLAGSVHAQATRSTMVQSAALHCSTPAGSGIFNVISWSVGASSTIQPGAGASGSEAKAGRPQLGPINLVKVFDECSAALFGNLVTGSILQTVTLTDHDSPNATGRETKQPVSNLTIQLQNVQITQYVVSDGGSSPSESISLAYDRITITNTSNGSKFCWDMRLNNSCS